LIDLVPALHRHFGFGSFRACQDALMRAVLEGRDVPAVMASG
jgi:superfamily II DNA helicase RecQ